MGEERIKRYYEIQEIRAVDPTEDEPGAIIEGMAVPYGVRTTIGPWFEEIIMRGALDGCDLKDVPLFIHHNSRAIPLARSRNNNSNSTMQLMVKDTGLHFRANLDTENNTEAKSLYSATKRKDVSGMSFSFSVKEEKWLNLDTNMPTREIHKFKKIYEISALWNPQYEETNIAAARADAPDGIDKLALDNARAAEPESSNARSNGTPNTNNELELEKIKFLKFY